MSEKLSKQNVAVKLSVKNAKKILKILNMFEESIFGHAREGLEINKPKFFAIGEIAGPWFIHMIEDGDWLRVGERKLKRYGKTVVKPNELRDILAREHLKKGDVCIFRNVDGDHIGRFDRVRPEAEVFPGEFEVSNYVDPIQCDPQEAGGKGVFSNFVRYATPQEIAQLHWCEGAPEPKKEEIEAVTKELLKTPTTVIGDVEAPVAYLTWEDTKEGSRTVVLHVEGTVVIETKHTYMTINIDPTNMEVINHSKSPGEAETCKNIEI